MSTDVPLCLNILSMCNTAIHRRYYWNPKVFDAANPVSHRQAEIEWCQINAHHESQPFQEFFKDVADIKLKEVLVHRGIEDSAKGTIDGCNFAYNESSLLNSIMSM